ncbi:MAG: selenide, water dikinase SelD [Bdellovibrio sp.]|jgi:selenide,water dikinase
MEQTLPLRLTQTVQKGGCAAKVAALELRQILSQVRFPPPLPALLIDSGTFDDAAIFKVSPELALVQTLDFFTPIVDSPALFGKIASANALSDIYAMGGKPMTAMAIFAFPLGVLDNSVAVEVLQGASDLIAEASACFVGGHTIDDDTMKFGLSVTGFVHPDRVWSNAGARAGDVLILTKPLGTGTLTAALKRGEVNESQIQDALQSMCLLNDVPSQLSAELLGAIHAATDITGFGFAGHALNMARASAVSFEIELSQVPRFERAHEFLSKGFLTKAHRTNSEYVRDHAEFNNIDSGSQQLVFDPQTSGGLLLAVDPTFVDQVLASLRARFAAARTVGIVTKPQPRPLYFL